MTGALLSKSERILIRVISEIRGQNLFRLRGGVWLSGAFNRAVFTLVALLWLAFSTALHGAVTAVGSIGLTVGDLDREVEFFTHVLPFEKISESRGSGVEVEKLYALPGAQIRSATLRLGSETITLTEFTAPRGQAIPSDSRSYDRWFQHIAIVVRDMDAAYAVLAKARVRHVSTSPQTLPASNPTRAESRRFIFRIPKRTCWKLFGFPPEKATRAGSSRPINFFSGSITPRSS